MSLVACLLKHCVQSSDGGHDAPDTGDPVHRAARSGGISQTTPWHKICSF